MKDLTSEKLFNVYTILVQAFTKALLGQPAIY
jgi:hypothetical protein